MFGRDKIAKAAKEIADHLQIVENVNALKQAQKELADAVKILGDRVTSIETNFKVTKAEIAKEAMESAIGVVSSVQSTFNERMENLAVRVAKFEYAAQHPTQPTIDISPQTHDAAQLRDGRSKRPPPSGGSPPPE